MGSTLISIPIVLASASPARRQLLHNVGIDPEIVVSHVDEHALVAAHGWTDIRAVAGGLAQAKAEAVEKLIQHDEVIVIGCDSVMEFDGEIYGKPGSRKTAIERLRAMSGGRGSLHTGHWVIHRTLSSTVGVGTVVDTEVVFHHMTEAEIAAYVDTEEPLHVAGSYTLDSLGGVFIKEIHGDPSNVIGLSVPNLRLLFAEIGIGWEEILMLHHQKPASDS
jgi:septum formation protein